MKVEQDTSVSLPGFRHVKTHYQNFLFWLHINTSNTQVPAHLQCNSSNFCVLKFVMGLVWALLGIQFHVK